ncbi:glycosyltransferase family 2 protein [Methylobacterium sp. P31]
MSGYFPQIGATMVRRRVVDAIGLFDEALLGDQDWDWQLRAIRAHGVGFVAVPCVHFRQRPAGTFDRLIARRIHFTRLVFRRHAPALGVSRLAALRLYFGTVQGYYDALLDAAEAHAARGDRRAAAGALLTAFRLMPHRAIRQVFRPTRLRAAVLAVIAAQGSGAADRREGALSRASQVITCPEELGLRAGRALPLLQRGGRG